MPMAFKTTGGVLGTGSTTLYTCPADHVAIITSLRAANVTNPGASVTYELAVNGRTIGKALAIDEGEVHMHIEDGNLYLAAGQTATGLASAGSSVDVTLGVVEKPVA